MSDKFSYRILDRGNLFVNQIRPHKHKWAWDLFLTGSNNNWNPNKIPMSDDIKQWPSLSDDEKLVIKRCLGFFAGAESLVSNNILINIFEPICDGECRQYLFRQIYEESLHNQTIVYICDSLNLDEKELYEAYRNIPVVKDKDDFLIRWTKEAKDAPIEQIIKNIFTYYIVCEGILFYSSFAILLSFGRQGKLPGIVSQINYTLRDEANHVQFGTELLNVIQREYPEIFKKEFKEELLTIIKEALLLEERFAREVLPNGILGVNADLLVKYVKFTANRRLINLGWPIIFDCKINPFPWLSEVVDMDKMTNYFERPVQNYATGAVVDDY